MDVHVGGTLSVAANQPTGDYSGQLNVTSPSFTSKRWPVRLD
jgi:hypothetical protein